METMNVYLAGVGGQGIGLLTEVIMRAADHAGLNIKGVDTHGLAQRGGIVISQLRFGDRVYTPLIPEGEADLVIALERHEALRAVNDALKEGGTVIYYNTVWQPLEVRLRGAEEVTASMIKEACKGRGIREIRVFKDDLDDPRMQNMVLLAHVDKRGLIPGVDTGHYTRAMDDLMAGPMLEKNLRLFQEVRAAA